MTLWNIHNEDLLQDSVKSVALRLQNDIDKANKDPLENAIWCAGDWNFLAPGDSQMSLASPSRSPSASDSPTPLRKNQKLWQDKLDQLVEVQQIGPTHFTASSLTCARIDRIYTSTPG